MNGERILVISDSPALASGLARVTRELAGRFHRDNRPVAVAGWFHNDSQMPLSFPFPVYHCDKANPPSVLPIVRQFKPNTILAIGDPWNFEWLSQVRAEKGGGRLIGYLNIEASPIPPNLEVVFDGFDVLTTTSEFGARVINRPGVIPIHHGVDKGTFFPTDKPEGMKFDRNLNETFVVLLNAQNSQRKNLTVALQGFALFAKGKKDVLVYANTQSIPTPTEYPGVNLEDLIIELGMVEHVAFNPENLGPHSTSSDAAMNVIYGHADTLLITSMAEGFCLPLLEAMATKTVPIAPAAFSATELLADGRGELIPIAATVRGPLGTDFSLVRPEDVAQALERVYRAWRIKELEAYHEPGLAFARTKSWTGTYKAISEAMEKPKARLADGRTIDSRLRTRIRAVPTDCHNVAVVKLGGLGDMLQTTCVVEAAARKYGTEVTVITNRSEEVFLGLSSVSGVVGCGSIPQDQVVRSLVDEFRIVLDVRYVSGIYGEPQTEFFNRHRWFYDNWLASCSRLADLGLHTTEVMLASLGLENHAGHPAIKPTYMLRSPIAVLGPYVAVAAGSGVLGELKQAPAAWWQQAITQLKNNGLKVVQVGGPDDVNLYADIDMRNPDLRVQASLVEKAVCLLAPEGGMVHLAAAVGTKAVVLFGPTPVVLFGYPWNTNLSGSLCSPCWWGPAWEAQICTMRPVGGCANIVEPEYAVKSVMDLVGEVVPA